MDEKSLRQYAFSKNLDHAFDLDFLDVDNTNQVNTKRIINLDLNDDRNIIDLDNENDIKINIKDNNFDEDNNFDKEAIKWIYYTIPGMGLGSDSFYCKYCEDIVSSRDNITHKSEPLHLQRKNKKLRHCFQCFSDIEVNNWGIHLEELDHKINMKKYQEQEMRTCFICNERLFINNQEEWDTHNEYHSISNYTNNDKYTEPNNYKRKKETIYKRKKKISQ